MHRTSSCVYCFRAVCSVIVVCFVLCSCDLAVHSEMFELGETSALSVSRIRSSYNMVAVLLRFVDIAAQELR